MAIIMATTALAVTRIVGTNNDITYTEDNIPDNILKGYWVVDDTLSGAGCEINSVTCDTSDFYGCSKYGNSIRIVSNTDDAGNNLQRSVTVNLEGQNTCTLTGNYAEGWRTDVGVVYGEVLSMGSDTITLINTCASKGGVCCTTGFCNGNTSSTSDCIGGLCCIGQCITCIDSYWLPAASEVCTGTSLVQTSNCNNTRNTTGTKVCGGTTNCTDTTWTPLASTICSGIVFNQTSNCNHTKTSLGSKICTNITGISGATCEDTLGCEFWQNCNTNKTSCTLAGWVYIVLVAFGLFAILRVMKK